MEYRVTALTPPLLPPEASRDLAAAEIEGGEPEGFSEGLFEPRNE
jgi:hypothetical protein